MSQDSPLSRLIGGRYQLEHRIARGGMAEVWLASDTFLHRQVAVKLLKPHLANDANVADGEAIDPDATPDDSTPAAE